MAITEAERQAQQQKAQEFKARKQLEGKFGGQKAIEKTLEKGTPVQKEAVRTAMLEQQLRQAAREDETGNRFAQVAKTIATYQPLYVARQVLKRVGLTDEQVQQLRQYGAYETRTRTTTPPEPTVTPTTPSVPVETATPTTEGITPTPSTIGITGAVVQEPSIAEVPAEEPATIRALTKEEEEFGIFTNPYNLPERVNPEVKDALETAISQPADELERAISEILRGGVEKTLQFEQKKFNQFKSLLTKQVNQARINELKGEPKTIIGEYKTFGAKVGLLVLTTGEALGELIMLPPSQQQEIIRNIPSVVYKGIREGINVGDPRKLPPAEILATAAFETLFAFSPKGVKNVIARETIEFTAKGKPVKVTTIGLEIKNTGRSIPIYTKVEGIESGTKLTLEELDKAVKVPTTKTGLQSLKKKFDLSPEQVQRVDSVIDTLRLQYSEKGLLAKNAVFELNLLKNKQQSGDIIMDTISKNDGVLFGSTVTQKLPAGYRTKIGDIDVLFPTKTEEELMVMVKDLEQKLISIGEDVRVSPRNPLIIESSVKESAEFAGSGEKIFESKSGVNPSKFSIGDDDLAGTGIGGFQFPDLKKGLTDRTVPLGDARSITVGEQLERKGAAVSFFRPAEFSNTPEAFQVAGILPRGRRTKDIPSFIITSKGISQIQKDSGNIIRMFKGKRAETTLQKYIDTFTPEQQAVIQEMIEDVQLEGAKSIVVYKASEKSAPVVSPIPNIIGGAGLGTYPVVATIPEISTPVIFSEAPIATDTGISKGVSSSMKIPPPLSDTVVPPVSPNIVNKFVSPSKQITTSDVFSPTISVPTTIPSPTPIVPSVPPSEVVSQVPSGFSLGISQGTISPSTFVSSGTAFQIISPSISPISEPSPSPVIQSPTQPPSPSPSFTSTSPSEIPSGISPTVSPPPTSPSPFTPISPSPTPPPVSPISPITPSPSPISPVPSPTPSPSPSPIPVSRVPPPPVTRIIPKKKEPSKKVKVEKELKQLYRLLIKKPQGKFKEVPPLDFKGRQTKKGAGIVDRTIAATFKLEPTRKFRKGEDIRFEPSYKFRRYQVRKGKKILLKDTWIEKRKYRLDMPDEIKTLKISKKYSPKKNKTRRSKMLGGMKLFR